MIKRIESKEKKAEISRKILESLPEWFGIPEAREGYISDSLGQIFFCAEENGNYVGFLCLKRTGKDTAELAVMGVLKEFQHRGIGQAQFHAAKEYADRVGFSFLQVKTVQMGRYPEYDKTNEFYLRLGFREFEVFPALWDEWNPCQIYIMAIR